MADDDFCVKIPANLISLSSYLAAYAPYITADAEEADGMRRDSLLLSSTLLKSFDVGKKPPSICAKCPRLQIQQ